MTAQAFAGLASVVVRPAEISETVIRNSALSLRQKAPLSSPPDVICQTVSGESDSERFPSKALAREYRLALSAEKRLAAAIEHTRERLEARRPNILPLGQT